METHIEPYTGVGIVNRHPDDVVFHIDMKNEEANRMVRRKVWELFMEFKLIYPESVIESSDPEEFIGDLHRSRLFISVCMTDQKMKYKHTAVSTIGEPIRLYRCVRPIANGSSLTNEILAPVKLFFITMSENYPTELYNQIHWSLLSHIGVIVVLVYVLGMPIYGYDISLIQEMQRRYQNTDETVSQVFMQSSDHPHTIETMFSYREIKRYFRVMSVHAPLVTSAGEAADISVLLSNEIKTLHYMVQSMGND